MRTVCFIIFTSALAFLLTGQTIAQTPRQIADKSLPSAWPQQSQHPNQTRVGTLSPDEIFKRVSLAIFVVEEFDAYDKPLAFGSGVLVTLPKQVSSSSPAEQVPVIVTNRHVVEDGTRFRVSQGKNHWIAKVRYWDDGHDLCGLTVEGLQAAPVQVRRSSSVLVGEHVYAIGAPEGLELTLSEGLVSGFRDFEEEGHVIQTSAPISKGSSGGGLFDSRAQLIGITTFYLKGGQNLNFAIPSEQLLEISSHDTDATVGSPPASATEWRLAAREAEHKKNYEKAIRAYREAIRLEPNDDKNWTALGSLYRYQQNYDEALKCYLEAVRLGKDRPLNWYFLFGLEMQRHEYREAVLAAQVMVRLEPGEGTPWMALGSAYRLAGKQREEAVKAFQEAVRVQPSNSKCWIALGRAQRESGQLDSSLESLQGALRLTPDEVSAWYELGLTYLKQGNHEEAFHVCLKLYELNFRFSRQAKRKALSNEQIASFRRPFSRTFVTPIRIPRHNKDLLKHQTLTS